MKKYIFGISILLLFYLYRMTSPGANITHLTNHPIATVTLSDDSKFKIALFPDEAPNTVNNFISLSQNGFYSNTYINRIVPNFLIQGGDPIGNGYGYPGYYIKSECSYNKVSNHLKHTKGTVSMARSENFNTEGSQFFILLSDAPSLNGKYSAFGKIIEGIDVIEKLGEKGVHTDYSPVEELRIQSIEIETHGKVYSEPIVEVP